MHPSCWHNSVAKTAITYHSKCTTTAIDTHMKYTASTAIQNTALVTIERSSFVLMIHISAIVPYKIESINR